MDEEAIRSVVAEQNITDGYILLHLRAFRETRHQRVKPGEGWDTGSRASSRGEDIKHDLSWRAVLRLHRYSLTLTHGYRALAKLKETIERGKIQITFSSWNPSEAKCKLFKKKKKKQEKDFHIFIDDGNALRMCPGEGPWLPCHH